MSAAEHEPVDPLCPHGDDHHEPPRLEYYTIWDDSADEHKGVLYDPDEPQTWLEMSLWMVLDVEAMA